MSADWTDRDRRVRLHAALADSARLRIIDILTLGDASPSELAEAIRAPSNLVAHHLGVLEREGMISRKKSEADRRRNYVQLVPDWLAHLTPQSQRPAARVVFVCTRNSARSHLAAALWRGVSRIPADSAGTRPSERIASGAIDAARRHRLDLPRVHPRHVDDVLGFGDFVISVCDRAHEELGLPVDIHWSVADPVSSDSPSAFDEALADLSRRAADLAPRLSYQPIEGDSP